MFYKWSFLIPRLNIFPLTFQMHSLSSLFLLCASMIPACVDSPLASISSDCIGFSSWGPWKEFCRGRRACGVGVIPHLSLQGHLRLVGLGREGHSSCLTVLSTQPLFLQVTESVPFLVSGIGVGRLVLIGPSGRHNPVCFTGTLADGSYINCSLTQFECVIYYWLRP